MNFSDLFCLCLQEGILQKLQRSVEQEESKWKVKADESRRTIKQVFKDELRAAVPSSGVPTSVLWEL